MNPIILTTALIINSVSGWNIRGSPERKQQSADSCSAMNKSSIFNQTDSSTWGVCWEAMTYKKLDLSNVTGVFQPGFWEPDYPEIMDFCSDKGNGTYCYRRNSQMNDSCLDMAVVRCPEGVISSCRSNFICNEVMSQNVTCDASVGSIFNTNYTESAQARCQAIEDVIKLPPAQNVTTTVDQQNNTITVGSQIFGFPFAITTTVDCTFKCISSLPSGFPQPTEVMTACYNDSLPYDQLIPKSTCVGPYPPGPMTTVTETLFSSTESATVIPTDVVPSSVEPTSSMMSSTEEASPTSTEVSQCPIGSSVKADLSSDSGASVAGYSSSMPEVSPIPCGGQDEEMPSEPTASPTGYYY